MENLLQRLVERTNEGDQPEATRQKTASSEDVAPLDATTRKIYPSAEGHRQRPQASNEVAPAAAAASKKQAQEAADDADKPKFLRAMEEREARRRRLKEERLTRMAAKQREAAVRTAPERTSHCCAVFCRGPHINLYYQELERKALEEQERLAVEEERRALEERRRARREREVGWR